MISTFLTMHRCPLNDSLDSTALLNDITFILGLPSPSYFSFS